MEKNRKCNRERQVLKAYSFLSRRDESNEPKKPTKIRQGGKRQPSILLKTGLKAKAGGMKGIRWAMQVKVMR